jgi:predicted DCC family thiol-disulfide oxidoreductase YuxK
MSSVVLFDGVCNFCEGTVNFIIARDPHAYFRFAALQSPVAHQLLESCASPPPTSDSLVLVEGEKCYTRSTAALRIARRLRSPWFLLYGLIIVPRPIRDALYDWFARNRYRWFGKQDECLVPDTDTRRRFLDC